MTHRKKNLRIYDAISYEDALDTSERRSGLTLAERHEARGIVDTMRMRVLEKQRADRATSRVSRIRPSILAMTRDAMMGRLAELLAARPLAVFAFHDLTVLSDDDLRTVLEDVEALAEPTT